MVLSYKHQIAEDNLIAKMKSFPEKYKHYRDRPVKSVSQESTIPRIPLKGIPKEIKLPLKKQDSQQQEQLLTGNQANG